MIWAYVSYVVCIVKERVRLKKLNRLQEESYRAAGIALDGEICRIRQGITGAQQHEKNTFVLPNERCR